jgi:hypothetical protein
MLFGHGLSMLVGRGTALLCPYTTAIAVGYRNKNQESSALRTLVYSNLNCKIYH